MLIFIKNIAVTECIMFIKVIHRLKGKVFKKESNQKRLDFKGLLKYNVPAIFADIRRWIFYEDDISA